MREVRASSHGLGNHGPLQQSELVLHGRHVDEHNLLRHGASAPSVAVRALVPLLQVVQDAKDRSHLRQSIHASRERGWQGLICEERRTVLSRTKLLPQKHASSSGSRQHCLDQIVRITLRAVTGTRNVSSHTFTDA